MTEVEETLFGDGAKDQAPNVAEPINCNFDRHISVFQFQYQYR